MSRGEWIILGTVTAFALVWGAHSAVPGRDYHYTGALFTYSFGYAGGFAAMTYAFLRITRPKKKLKEDKEGA
jgi:hypothetical protein